MQNNRRTRDNPLAGRAVARKPLPSRPPYWVCVHRGGRLYSIWGWRFSRILSGTSGEPWSNQYKTLHHRVYVLGVTVLGGVIAAAGFWKDSHLIALLILATFIVLASIYEMHVRGWSIRAIIWFFALCYSLAWIVYQIVGPNLPEETDREVYLMPGNKPSPFSACAAGAGSNKPPNGSIAFLVGSNEFWSTHEGEYNVITIDGKPIVTMKKSEEGLLFSVDMFNTEKKIVAKIRNNKSILTPKNYSYKDRSADRSTLTLHDDYDREILYVEYLNRSAVLLKGVFTGHSGTTIAVDDNQIATSQCSTV
jgi:hypothetical protein